MIEVSGIKKSYNDIEALRGISFEIGSGEVYGLLGPNGAGKTTTISILSTILKPDAGKVKINGIDLKSRPKACKQIIGVVPQEISLYDQLSAYDNLMFWGSLYNIKPQELKDKVASTLELLGLSARRNDKIKTYSGGMKRRINLASALLHSPEILFMDEPTVGIDPQSRNLIYDVIEKLHKDGLTIIYTTHYMEEAQRLCDRIGIIDKGEIIAQGTLDELRKISNTEETINIVLSESINGTEEKLGSILDKKHTVTGNTVTVFTDDSKSDLPNVIMKINKAGLEINQVEIQKVNLETIFLNLTGKQLRD